MFRIEHYTSVSQLPLPVWDPFVSRQAVGLEVDHLKAVEISQINEIHPYYLIIYQDEEPVGIAYCFSIEADLARMTNHCPREVLDTIKTWKPDFMTKRLLEVGHIASLGTTINIREAVSNEFLSCFSKKLDEIARLENAELCLIRDIPVQDFPFFQAFSELGFHSVLGFTLAKMEVKWCSFDEYLASLKAKKRATIRLYRKKLQAPEISVEVIDDYAPYAERLSELWTNVAKRNNGYDHEHLTPAFFQSMSQNLKGRSHVVAIKRYGEMIAFGLNLIGDDELFGMAEGMDYAFRDEYDLYANNLLEGVRMACELGKKWYNIGITSYDFKTSIGAELQPVVYFVKSFQEPSFSLVYADLIRKSIDQPENRHRAFSGQTNENRVSLQQTQAVVKKGDRSPDPFEKHYNYLRIETVRSADLYTYCPVFESAQEPVIFHNGRKVLMLGTNSYLGLATHPKVKAAAHEALEKYGTGCSGSPLLNGTLDLHKQLSAQLAWFINKPDALVFSTGYQTNLGAISGLVNRDDVLIMDERNHASLIDGARLSRATLVRYRHNDPESLESILKKYADKPKLVVTDSLFSMEGTMANLPAIVSLVKKYHARLMLDESHAIGVIGPCGRGVAEHFGLTDDVDIVMGTFSKSLASIGGFIAGDRKIIDTLRHTARSHIFSASLPPSSVAAVMASLQIIEEEPERRKQLLANAKFMAEGLLNLGYQVDYQGSAIVPLFCGHELLAVAAFHQFFEEGVFVNPVTSPAVPKNQEMLRISLMATHTEEMLQQALKVFEAVRTVHWPERLKNEYQCPLTLVNGFAGV